MPDGDYGTSVCLQLTTSGLAPPWNKRNVFRVWPAMEAVCTRAVFITWLLLSDSCFGSLNEKRTTEDNSVATLTVLLLLFIVYKAIVWQAGYKPSKFIRSSIALRKKEHWRTELSIWNKFM